MAVERLRVILEMAAGQYKKEAQDAASATSKIADGAQRSAGRIQAMSVAVGTFAGNVAYDLGRRALTGVKDFVKDSVRAATDLRESVNAVQVVFGDAADGVLAIGESAADSFGLAESEFNQFAVQFSNFASTISTGSGQSIVGVVEDITRRVADFASVMNIDVPEAAEKFQSGLAGQVRPLREYGIDVSDAATKQKALELGLAETSGELTEQDKVLARYKLIMEQTSKTAGDFKNTQDDLANATRTLSANFEDFKATAGEQLAPELAELAGQGIQLFDILDSDVNLGWSQRLSAVTQSLLGESQESIDAYVRERSAINDRNEALAKSTPITDAAAHSISEANTAAREGGEYQKAFGAAIEDTTDETEELAEATKTVISRLEEFQNVVRAQVDPVFALRDANDRVQESLEALGEAEQEFGRNSPEYLDALSDLTEAGYDLQEAQIRVATESHLTREAFESQLRAMRIFTDDQIAAMLTEFEKINGFKFNDKEFSITVHGKEVVSQEISDKRTQASFSGIDRRASGGRLDRLQPSIVGEKGPEFFVPDRPGMVISNADVQRLMAGGSRSTVNNFNIDHIDTQTDAQLVGAIASVMRRMETI